MAVLPGARAMVSGQNRREGPQLKNRQWLLARRPDGALKDSDFTLVEAEAPTPGEGEALIRNLIFVLRPDAARLDRRGHLSAGGQDWRGRPLVRRGPDRSVEPSGLQAWRHHARPRGLAGLCRDETRRPEQAAPRAPIELAMGVLGMIGMTAYFGLLDVGRPVAGETVVVSGAAGATGSLVGQIAKIKGCRVIGIAGGAEKCRWLTQDLGLDAAIDYKGENVKARLKELCPKGIDIFFDNVGGDILDAALGRLAMRVGSFSAAGSRLTTPPSRRLGRGTT